MFWKPATRWRGCTSWPPSPKIAVISLGILASGGTSAKTSVAASAFARAWNSAWVTSRVSAVSSERSMTVTALALPIAATSSASGKGCSNLTETTPTFRPCARRWGSTARTSSVIEPIPTIT